MLNKRLNYMILKFNLVFSCQNICFITKFTITIISVILAQKLYFFRDLE